MIRRLSVLSSSVQPEILEDAYVKILGKLFGLSARVLSGKLGNAVCPPEVNIWFYLVEDETWQISKSDNPAACYFEKGVKAGRIPAFLTQFPAFAQVMTKLSKVQKSSNRDVVYQKFSHSKMRHYAFSPPQKFKTAM